MFKDHILNYFWIIQAIFIIVSTYVLVLIQEFIYKKLLPKTKISSSVWSDSFFKALYTPLKTLLYFSGVIFAIYTALPNFIKLEEMTFLSIIHQVGSVIIVVWLLTRFSKEIELNLSKPRKGHKALNKTTLRAISQLMRLVVIVVAGLIIMQTCRIPITGIVAFGGVGGIAVGFAAKDLLANFFGGFMIFLDKPFSIGDWIRSSDKEIEGTVEHIGWRLTRIRTFDKRPLYVPNSVFSTIAIENPSRMSNRRIKAHIGIRYDDGAKLKKVLDDITEMLKNHPDIDTTKTLFVKMVEFGPYALIFQVYTFTKTTNWVEYQSIQQDVFLKIFDIIKNNDAQCAFPTTTMHVPESVGINLNKKD
jgi:MscS family membrane protein